ncbi:glycosyltransferase family 9 protein [Desulfovibrio subterraneus]|uniref:Heptosyltransferase n=1 Tax=Desulfovibrio subterraneus TaxID=2718620 RepID=A0A7J0BIP9_9BACT|nr:glycosyltransferase family 9 protein [Desulfovibrio subterraneus]GFM33519.1 heptosyltransferase [Desulfovibrio subterraneus]
MSRIGIWNTAFLGDAVLTLPLIRTVRAAYPDAEIDFYVRKGLRSLFTGQPELAEVYEYDKRGSQNGFLAAASMGRELASRNYSLWISAHTSLRSGIIARWTSARMRIGYSRPFFNQWFYTHTVDRRFPELEEIERLLQLVKPLGIEHVHDWPELVLPADALAAADAFWQERITGPVLGVHPGSVWGTKRWPAASYAEIVRRGVEAGAQVLVFAGPGEEHMAREVLDTCGVAALDKVIDLSAKLSLPVLAAYLGRLDCYVTNDSGPMHLAWAQKTPVTAIFGPTVQALGFYPRGKDSTVLEADVACRPCGLHGPQECPKEHFACMRQVTPDMVWKDVEGKLFRNAATI